MQFDAAEDDGLRKVVAQWEQATGKTAELSFYASGDTEAKVVTAMKGIWTPHQNRFFDT